jgi:hypothetical protein
MQDNGELIDIENLIPLEDYKKDSYGDSCYFIERGTKTGWRYDFLERTLHNLV